MSTMPEKGYQVFVNGHPTGKPVNSLTKASKGARIYRNAELSLPKDDPRQFRSSVCIIDFKTSKVLYWSEIRKYASQKRSSHKKEVAKKRDARKAKRC